MTAHDPLTEPFDAWLDRHAAGRSTPAAGESADPDLASLRAFAGQLHDLAGQEDARLLAASPPPRWEEFMHAATGSQVQSTVGSSGTRTPNPVIPSLRGISPSQRAYAPPRIAALVMRWQAAVSLAVVVAVLAGLVGIAWQRGVWNGSGNEPTPFGQAIASPEATLPAYVGEPLFVAASVPDPSECTVEPLTVDEVMERFEKGQGYVAYTNPFETGTPTTFADPASKKTSENGPSFEKVNDQGVVDSIASAQRQWLACSISGDYLRIWALESYDRVQQTIFAIYGPQFSPTALRSDLERLADGATDTPFRAVAMAPDAFVPMVATSGWDTYYTQPPEGTTVEIPLYWTSLDGSLAAIPGYLSEAQYNDPAYAVFRDNPTLPNRATFHYDNVSGGWLLDTFEAGASA